MSASSPGNGQYGGVLAGVKAKPSMWPTASLDTGCGHHPPAAARGSSKQLHHQIPTTEVPTESGEARAARDQHIGLSEWCQESRQALGVGLGDSEIREVSEYPAGGEYWADHHPAVSAPFDRPDKPKTSQ
jgi:hypothetical protein